MARIEAVEIQYKLSAYVDVVSGQIDYMFAPAVTVVGNRERLKMLAVTTAARSAILPDVPTVAEAALPGYEMYGARSILGPAGMSRDIVASLNKGIGRALATPEVRERLVKSGSEPTPSSPEELAKRYAEWAAKFEKIAKNAGIKPQ